MSSRALRKLQGNDDLDILGNSLNNDEDNDFASKKSRCKEKKAVNPFDLVSGLCFAHDEFLKNQIGEVFLILVQLSWLNHLTQLYLLFL